MDRTSSSTWVRGLVDMFAAQGVESARLAKAAHFDLQRLERPTERFTADEVTALWEAAIALSGDPWIGIDRELAAKYVNFDVVGYAMLSSPDLKSGLDGFARYLALISSATTFHLELEGVNTWLVLGHTGFSRPLPWQRSVYSLLAVLTLCRWVTRREIAPVDMRLAFAAPPMADRFLDAFGVMPTFDAKDHRMLFSAADMACVIPSRNAELLALHEQAMHQRLIALGNESTAYRVSEEIIRRLDRGEPRREDVAASLSLTDRTLQRRLKAENTSFQVLLDEARRELAKKYLADPRYALGQVAHMLGFANQSNFFRASRRWFGRPPAQMREELMSR